MDTIKRPVNTHQAYHAHVYFDKDNLAFATELCHSAGEKFGLKVGRMHQKCVGPHTQWSCQIIFNHKAFDAFIPWLDKQRGELNVLVHALSGNAIDDHTNYAYWLGDSVELNMDAFLD